MFLKPSYNYIFSIVEMIYIRFDIDDGCLIDHVNMCKVDTVLGNFVYFNDGEADVVGAVWTPYGEYTMWSILKIGFTLKMFLS